MSPRRRIEMSLSPSFSPFAINTHAYVSHVNATHTLTATLHYSLTLSPSNWNNSIYGHSSRPPWLRPLCMEPPLSWQKNGRIYQPALQTTPTQSQFHARKTPAEAPFSVKTGIPVGFFFPPFFFFKSLNMGRWYFNHNPDMTRATPFAWIPHRCSLILKRKCE